MLQAKDLVDDTFPANLLVAIEYRYDIKAGGEVVAAEWNIGIAGQGQVVFSKDS